MNASALPVAEKPDEDTLIIAGKVYSSRLLVGTGKYRDLEETGRAIEASGAEVVTVAIRRTNIGQTKDEPNLLDYVSPEKYTILPNTAGCFDADSALRTCRLARELLGGHDLVKLEVLGDKKTLFPDIPATLEAAEILVNESFKVMVYTNDDPIMALRFEEMGCIAVMPLAAPIGSGLGIRNPYNIRTIVENAGVPILVDAGVGTASDAAIAMELGCDGVLMNTAIAEAKNPIRVQMPYHPSRIARHHHIGRHLPADHRVRGHHAVVTDPHPLEHHAVVAQPDIVADVHRRNLLVSLDTVVDAVPVGIRDVHAVGNHDAVADDDFIAGADANPGADQHVISHPDGTRAGLSPPHPQFHRLAALADDGDAIADADIGSAERHIPGFHDGMV